MPNINDDFPYYPPTKQELEAKGYSTSPKASKRKFTAKDPIYKRLSRIEKLLNEVLKEVKKGGSQ